MSDTKLLDEPGRLAALHRYELLDTPSEEPFDRITDLVRTILNVPLATVSLIDADRQWLKSCSGPQLGEVPREVAFCSHTIRSREPMYIPDAKLDERFQNNPLVVGNPFIRSYLGVPLSTPDGYNVGSLCAIDFKPREFDAGQIQVLKTFAALVSKEVELRRIAQIDHLTGALTRRGFCLEAEKALYRFTRNGHQSALIMWDIDHFKGVNDTYGHAAGDRVLRSAARAIQDNLRASDVLGRMGGEEFGILVDDTDADQAYQSAERFRKALMTAVGEHLPEIRVTASFGVAQIDASCTNLDQWMAKADHAMYSAKRAGRNKTCCAPT